MNEARMAGALLAFDRVVILTHRRPDGDTVGSAAALCLGLRQKGKEAWVLENPQLTEKYSLWLEGLCCDRIPQDASLVAVDVAAEDMLLKGLPKGVEIALAIDHHGTNSGYAGQSLVRPERAACGEIIYDVLEAMEVEITKEIAAALYVALSTDTGCFRYSNVTENTFRVAAELLHTGVEVSSVNRSLFEIKRFARLKLEAYLTESMAFFSEHRIGICCIPHALREELGLTEDDMDDISGFARKIEGVEIAVMLRELPDEGVKISLRTDRRFDAGAICASLGGGGHICAAGASVHGTPEEAAKALLQAIYTRYPELKD